MTSAEFRAIHSHKPRPDASAPPVAASRPGKRPTTPSEPPKAVAVPKTKPIQWQVSEGLQTEQFPGRFRLVVVGEAHQLPQVLRALRALEGAAGESHSEQN